MSIQTVHKRIGFPTGGATLPVFNSGWSREQEIYPCVDGSLFIAYTSVLRGQEGSARVACLAGPNFVSADVSYMP